MRKSVLVISLMLAAGSSARLQAQQPCPGLTVAVNSPEDQLLLAVNGANDAPQDQVAALDKFVGAHAGSTAINCVNEYYTSAYLKLNDFAKAISFGEKDLTANVSDLYLYINLAKAYVGAGQASEGAFTLIAQAPAVIAAEIKPVRPPGTSDADWAKMQQDSADSAAQYRSYMEYAFFQLLPRVTDPNKRIQYLDGFTKGYPQSPNLGQAYMQYLIVYSSTGNGAKADEFAEKAVAADPNNPTTLVTVADDYATRRVNLDKAEADANKAISLVPGMKKPDSMADADFQAQQNLLLASAHFTLGSVGQQRGAATHKLASSIKEFRTAADMATANPALKGRALYYLGFAYESTIPADHKSARQALTESASLASPWQGEAQKLLAKIPAAK